MKNFVPEKYAIRIESHYDEKKTRTLFYGFVAELKSVFTEATSAEKAYKQIIDEIIILKEHYELKKLSFPEPISAQEFSGKLNFRLGSELHKKIATEAAQQGVSINDILLKKISA